jgi:hypothetical protein
MQNFHSSADQKLHEDLFNEFVQTWGLDLVYIPRTSESNSGFDLLFGDDPTKSYTNSYTIECYVLSVDSFEGGELFSKFNLQVKKQARLLMPNRAFKREVQGVLTRPQEGDLIWMPNFRALFEIKYVNEEYFFYDFGKGAAAPGDENQFYGFELIIEKFRYNDETVTTGISEIDETINSIAYVYNFVMSGNTGNGTYTLGETVYQGANLSSATCSAIVVSWDVPSGLLQLKTLQGLFTPGQTAVGANSAANWVVTSYAILDSINHLLSDNQDIETGANNYLNFTESNPFGNPD